MAPKSNTAAREPSLPPGPGGSVILIIMICTRRAGKLQRARSRLYRSRFLQVNANYSFESSRRDLHNTLLCTYIQSQLFVQKCYKKPSNNLTTTTESQND